MGKFKKANGEFNPADFVFKECDKETRCTKCFLAYKPELCELAKCTPEEGVPYGYYMYFKSSITKKIISTDTQSSSIQYND